MAELLAEITIPRYLTRIEISKKRRPKYYKRGSKIPPTYLKKYSFNKKGYLVDEKGNRVISNKRTVGKPRYETLSGNRLLSGYGNHNMRANIVKGLKEAYRPHVQRYLKEHGPITKFPLRVEWEVHTTVDQEVNWDASNLFFYYKYFEDCLFEGVKNKRLLSLIPDDSVKYITHPPGAKIIPIDRWEDRKFVFKFYHDVRTELNREPWQLPRE